MKRWQRRKLEHKESMARSEKLLTITHSSEIANKESLVQESLVPLSEVFSPEDIRKIIQGRRL